MPTKLHCFLPHMHVHAQDNPSSYPHNAASHSYCPPAKSDTPTNLPTPPPSRLSPTHEHTHNIYTIPDTPLLHQQSCSPRSTSAPVLTTGLSFLLQHISHRKLSAVGSIFFCTSADKFFCAAWRNGTSTFSCSAVNSAILAAVRASFSRSAVVKETPGQIKILPTIGLFVM